jgi:hypothetical protein
LGDLIVIPAGKDERERAFVIRIKGDHIVTFLIDRGALRSVAGHTMIKRLAWLQNELPPSVYGLHISPKVRRGKIC